MRADPACNLAIEGARLERARFAVPAREVDCLVAVELERQVTRACAGRTKLVGALWWRASEDDARWLTTAESQSHHSTSTTLAASGLSLDL